MIPLQRSELHGPSLGLSFHSLWPSFQPLDCGGGGELCLYDEDDALDWVEVDVGHDVEVQEGQHILLKNWNIQYCEDLHIFLEACSQYTPPHLYSNLPQEQAAICEMFKHLSLFTTPTQSPV